MKNSPQDNHIKTGFTRALLVIALPLLILFGGGIAPQNVLFSNDGTLGHLISQGDLAHTTFTGLWRPLNWVGEAAPSAQPSLTLGLFVALNSAIWFSKLFAPLAQPIRRVREPSILRRPGHLGQFGPGSLRPAGSLAAVRGQIKLGGNRHGKAGNLR